MGLEAYAVPTAFVPFSGKEDSPGITVRALDLDDVTILVTDHLGAIAETVELWQEIRPKLMQEGNLDKFLITVMRGSPELVAQLIAVSCDQPALVDVARKLSFGVQIRALNEVIRLTLEDAGGIKNLFAALRLALPGLVLRNPALATTQAESKQL